MDFGTAIKELRKYRQLSVRDLAKYANVSTETIYSAERNESTPSKKTITGICKALDISLPILLIFGLCEEDFSPHNRFAFRIIQNPIKEILIKDDKLF